jgi:hypothetical protein
MNTEITELPTRHETLDDEQEAKQADMFVKTYYNGVLPPVGTGHMNYLKALDEIEKRIHSGYYTKKLEMEKKLNYYKKYQQKIMKKLEHVTNPEKKKKYTDIARILEEKAEKLKLKF